MAERQLVFEDFGNCVNSTFSIAEAGVPATDLILEEAALLPARLARPDSRPAFSLIFRSPDDVVLPQALYHLKNAELGEIAIFLVPVGKDADGVSYQATFN